MKLNELKDDMRMDETIWDLAIKGWTYPELGRIYGITRQAIEDRIRRMEKRLGQELESIKQLK